MDDLKRCANTETYLINGRMGFSLTFGELDDGGQLCWR